MLAPPRKGDRKGLSKARFRVLNMNKEEMLEKIYGTIAYYMSCAVKDERIKEEYQLKTAGVLNVRSITDLIEQEEFHRMNDLLWHSPKSLYWYANKKSGNWYGEL